MIFLCLQHKLYQRKITIINIRKMKKGLRLLTISLLLIIVFNVNAQEDKKLTKKEAKVIEEKADFSFEEKPVATNETDEGRQLNRRTELKVLESK